MRANLGLSRNAILYISLGFTQDSLLQVLQLRKGSKNTLEMIVYDGIVYAGALLDYSSLRKMQKGQLGAKNQGQNEFREEDSKSQHPKMPRVLDVIRVQAVLHGKNQPLWINYLEIVQSGLTEILGQQIITLQEFMKRRRFLPVVELDENQKDDQSSKPSKNIKTNEFVHYPIHESRVEVQLSPGKQIEGQRFQSIQSHQNYPQEVGGNQANSIIERLMDQQIVIDQPELVAQPEQVREKEEQNIEAQVQIPPRESQMHSEQIISQVLKPAENIESVATINPEQNKSELIQLDSQKTKPAANNNTAVHQVVQIVVSQEEDEVQIVQTQKRPKPILSISTYSQKSMNKETKVSNLVMIKEEKKNLDQGIEQRIFIKDLYERMHRFKLVCRINYIDHFITQKGNERTKMILVDQSGDQISCLLLEKASEKQHNRKLNKGRTYIFENGEVEKDEMGILNLIMPWSGIRETKMLMESFNPTKMYRVGQMESLSTTFFAQKLINNANSNSINNRRSVAKEINVCGIYLGMNEQAKLVNNQFKVIGKLCDFDQQKSINFSLFVSQLVSFPREAGVVLSLHNMRVVQNQGTYRLESTKRSYWLIQNHSEHKYMSDLIELSKNQRWKEIQYKNLSQIVYVNRKIKELNEILLKMLEAQNCFSEIDCGVVSIRQTKEFPACIVCKKPVKHHDRPGAYCYNCKKIEAWNNRYYFVAEVADSTGSIDVKFSSDDIEGFLNVTLQEYSRLPPARRTELMELSTYQNILLKVKSQKMIGGSSHYVNKVQRTNHSRSLQEIRQKSIQEKLTYKTHW